MAKTPLGELDVAIKTKTFLPIYVFTGSEHGILSQYLKDVKNCFKTVVDSTIAVVMEESKYNSLFGGKKLYILTGSEFFNRAATDQEIEFLVRMYKQKNHTVIFVETNVSLVYKQTKALQAESLIEFKKLSQKQLEKIATQALTQSGKTIEPELVSYVIDQCDYDYTVVLNELQKLCCIDEVEITKEVVRKVTTRSTSAVVFDLIEMIANKRYGRAFDMYRNLTLRKESPLAILSLLYRQFKIIYQVKMLQEQRYSWNEMAEATDCKAFVIQKTMPLCANFTNKKLTNILVRCAETDLLIKSGKLRDVSAVLMLIAYTGIQEG